MVLSFKSQANLFQAKNVLRDLKMFTDNILEFFGLRTPFTLPKIIETLKEFS